MFTTTKCGRRDTSMQMNSFCRTSYFIIFRRKHRYTRNYITLEINNITYIFFNVLRTIFIRAKNTLRFSK